jgi:hypothetical protein
MEALGMDNKDLNEALKPEQIKVLPQFKEDSNGKH